MKNKIGICTLTALISLTCNAGENNCASLKSASSNAVSTADMHSMFSKIISACNSKQPDNFFALQTASVREKLITPLSTARKIELFNQYCTFSNDANRAIGGRPENGIHSIQQDDRKLSECGNKISYWYIHTTNGELVFRLKMALENNQFKINDH